MFLTDKTRNIHCYHTILARNQRNLMQILVYPKKWFEITKNSNIGSVGDFNAVLTALFMEGTEAWQQLWGGWEKRGNLGGRWILCIGDASQSLKSGSHHAILCSGDSSSNIFNGHLQLSFRRIWFKRTQSKDSIIVRIPHLRIPH